MTASHDLLLISHSSENRQSDHVSPNTMSPVVDADLLELARTVERSVPADLDGARQCLQSLSDAVRSRHERRRNISSQGPLSAPSHAERLRSLIARIAHDVDGGHVLAVSGLERQVRHYLEQGAPPSVEAWTSPIKKLRSSSPGRKASGRQWSPHR